MDGSIENDLPMKRIGELFNVNTFIVSQVNPHIIPFLNEDETAADINNFSIFKTLKNFLISEIKHICSQLEYLDLIPSFLSKYIKVFTQSYNADVNIIAKPRLLDYYNLFGNIDKVYMDEYKVLGARYTFPSMNLIYL